MEQENINRDLCSYLIGVGMKMAEAQSKADTIEIEGRTYMLMNGLATEILEHDIVPPENTKVFTLQGLVDFIKADVDGCFDDPAVRCLVVVESPRLVRVYSPIMGQKQQRLRIASCEYCNEYITFDVDMKPDEFVVMLQCRFEDTDSRAKVLAVVGNMSSEQSDMTMDDGVTQKISIRKGVVTNGVTQFKNPAYLRPIRTFVEVEQPESPFILRVNAGDPESKKPVTVSLHECDGGAWKVTAVQTIGNWLREKLDGLNVEVIS